MMSAQNVQAPQFDNSAKSPWSCFPCRQRKVRCDRHRPCFHCSKGGLTCSFPVSGRLPTRRQEISPASSSKKKQAVLLSRLRHLEDVVQQLSTQIESEAPEQARGPGPEYRYEPLLERPTSESEARMDNVADMQLDYLAKHFGQLIVGKSGSLYIGNRVWAVLANEVKQVRQAFEENDELDLDFDEEQFLATQIYKVPFLGASDGGRRALQPLPSQIPFIWETFIDNVDPFVKVLHVPSVGSVIRDSKGKFDVLSPAMESVMFAVSLAAIASLDKKEVEDNFGEPKSWLLSRLTMGTEQALSRAGVFSTTDLTVVQALVIYLEFADRSYGNRAVWILAGLLVRTAVSMGLHLDGSHFSSVTPFDTEMRRRVWWHICFLDTRVSDCEVSQISIPENLFNTQDPTNVNDADISPGVSCSPVARDGYTDMTIGLLRCELWRLHRKVEKTTAEPLENSESSIKSIAQKLEALEKSKNTIQQSYLAYLSSDNTMHAFVKSFTCVCLTKNELGIHHPDHFSEPDSTIHNDDQKDKLFLSALACLEYALALESEKWGWTYHGCIEWRSVGVVLVQLCTRPWGPLCERAWTGACKAVDTVLEAAKRKALKHPVHRLIELVRAHRQEEILRLQQLPEALRRLNHLAREPADVFRVADMTFDTLAAQTRLNLETAASTGVMEAGPYSVDLGLPSEIDMTLDWVDLWGDIGAEMAPTAFMTGKPVSSSPFTDTAMNNVRVCDDTFQEAEISIDQMENHVGDPFCWLAEYGIFDVGQDT